MREVTDPDELENARGAGVLYVELKCVACGKVETEKVTFSPTHDDYDFWCSCGKGMMGVCRWLVGGEAGGSER